MHFQTEDLSEDLSVVIRVLAAYALIKHSTTMMQTLADTILHTLLEL